MEDMKSEDAETRIKAMKLLSKVAEAMGPERTRKELVSFLSGECVYSLCHPTESLLCPPSLVQINLKMMMRFCWLWQGSSESSSPSWEACTSR